MKLREVHLLDEAVDDLDQGRAFYDAQEIGVGDYFIESVLGDISSLRLHAVRIDGGTGFSACCVLGFRSPPTTKSFPRG